VLELAYYRRTLFVQPPGPSAEEAKAVADSILGIEQQQVD
jgi:hypothetical protein